jgi:hypothetical protein
MKLNELGAQRQIDQIARVIENQVGRKIDFSALSQERARSMLTRVQGLLREHRSRPDFHHSEKNPAYLQLIMMEQGLAGAVGAAPTGTAVDPAQSMRTKATMQMRRKQIQDTIRAKQQEITALQREMNSPTLGVMENRRKLKESELQQAQVVMAAQDMVDQMQKVLEQVSAMQFKDLPALTDAIKNDMGTEQASAFQASASQALTTLLTSVQQAKTEMETAQSALTGQAPVVPGQEPAATDDQGDVDLSLDANIDAELPPPEEDEEELPRAAFGRERR